MPKINDDFLASSVATPSSGQVIYRDTELLGFAIRVTPKSKSFIVERRVNGINRRVTVGRFEQLSLD